MKVPESLKEEHGAFIDGLKRRATGKDRTGAAVRQLLKLLGPHVEKEDELVLPLLGALSGLAERRALENQSAVMRSCEAYAAQYRKMFAEHSPIKRAIKRARSAAKTEGYGDTVELLDALAHHSRVEEEVLYPAALLVGVAIGPRRAPGAGASRSPPATATSYFALDYDAPISEVARTLTIRHHDIDHILSEVKELADRGKLNVAVSLLNAVSPLILRSAVEEEARVMRVVMQKSKSRTQPSIAIAREHRDIVDFLKHRLPELGSRPPDEARRSIHAFVGLTRRHLREEEKVPFSLAAK